MMRFPLAPLAIILSLFAGVSAAQDAPAIPPVRPSKIILVGDSTTAVASGWDSAFCAGHVLSDLACLNLGREGRSSSSYRVEGSWAVALGEMSAPGYERTYVLIQFGHNDQPGKPGRSTDLETTFPDNLRAYVAEVRARGAVPVLVTPLTRRIFEDGVLQNTLEPWAEAVRRVAAETGAPVVDLNRISAAAVQAMGSGAAAGFAQTPPSGDTATGLLAGGAPPLSGVRTPPPPAEGAVDPMGQAPLTFDYTHLGPDGARFFARMAAAELARVVPELRPLLVL